ncbi:hypothetical protein HDU96_000765, partial [Phlyctochytrium bullatum]
RDNAKVQGIITNNVSNEILPMVKDLKSAAVMVNPLKEQFELTSIASRVELLDQVLDLMYEPGEQIATHIGKAGALINMIKEAGGLDINQLHVVVLLRSMPQTTEWVQ